ncbi:MAG: PhzF family phenazine biosynthesis protein [Saprospiraceae bacterium]|jgi:PhzF family phenazine biosynthesis protein
MRIKTFLVDSFTTIPFQGNPAGVCLLEEVIGEELMQSIATELRYSETAFVLKTNVSNNYIIRFFSPKMEIPLCGHATLASSKVLFEQFETLGNLSFLNIDNIEINIQKLETGIEFFFPAYGTETAEVPTALIQALGILEIVNCEYNRETKILLLEINSSIELRELQPDFEALLKSHDSISGVLVTARSEEKEYDFESRYFWPWSGTNEDPVTGGTHTFLAPYWSCRLDKKKMTSFQCSERTGLMELEVTNQDTVIIKSDAVIILEGEMRV